jgi:hypothetical protein
MPRVIVESPYAGDVERNIAYAKRAVRDSLSRSEAPIASHLLLPANEVVDDLIAHERRCGIRAGLAWAIVADYMAVYTDYGISKGMSSAIRFARKIGLPTYYRTIGKN